MGVEPTIRPAKDRIAGFEDREGHRTPFASELVSLSCSKYLLDILNPGALREGLWCYWGAIHDAGNSLMQVGDGQVRVSLRHRQPLVSEQLRDVPKRHASLAQPAVALDAKGHIFVFTRAPHPLLEFDPEGNFVRAYGEGIFTRPHGLRFDPEGNIWLIDRDAHFVLKMSPDGRVLMVLGRHNQPGVVGNHSKQLFNEPTDVAFGHSGDVFVTDGYGNSRVVKFDKTGKFLKAWGQRGTGPGEFNIPHSIVVDSKGLLHIADRHMDWRNSQSLTKRVPEHRQVAF